MNEISVVKINVQSVKESKLLPKSVICSINLAEIPSILSLTAIIAKIKIAMLVFSSNMEIIKKGINNNLIKVIRLGILRTLSLTRLLNLIKYSSPEIIVKITAMTITCHAKGNFRITSKIPAVCEIVLSLPRMLALTTVPFETNISLKPVIIHSLAIITTAIQAGMPLPIKKINAAEIKSLSAIGSINFPISVISFLFLATYPSSASDKERIIKIKAAKYSL